MKNKDLHLIRSMNDNQLMDFIRDKLTINKELEERHSYRLRFEMSGYEINAGDCTLHNQRVLNTFAYLGIYDYTHYLFLDFYKGTPELYWRRFGCDQNQYKTFGGYTTSSIILEIFKLTILSNSPGRRRN